MEITECEDYLEAIINNSVEDVTPDSLKILADALNKDISEIEGGLKALCDEDFIRIDRDGAYPRIKLTHAGRKLGECTIKKHLVLESFFTEILGMDSHSASKEACVLEHGASPETIKRLHNYIKESGLKHRMHTRNPDGGHFSHGFSHRHGGSRDDDTGDIGRNLSEFNEDDAVKILFTDGGSRRTDRLCDMGLIPGETVTIKRKLSNGAMVVAIKSSEVGISPEIARLVYVEKV
ncbi:MAG: metal-dependent transcriptional regulator [Methanomicrobium sp.]|nr:metal-dependent transcriptional regulator [Methanomicrobium sp.]